MDTIIVKFPVLGRTGDEWPPTMDGLLLPVVGVSRGAGPIVAVGQTKRAVVVRYEFPTEKNKMVFFLQRFTQNENKPFAGQFVEDQVCGLGVCVRINPDGARHVHSGRFSKNSARGFGTQEVKNVIQATGVYTKGALTKGFVFILCESLQKKHHFVFFGGKFIANDNGALGLADGRGVDSTQFILFIITVIFITLCNITINKIMFHYFRFFHSICTCWTQA